MGYSPSEEVHTLCAEPTTWEIITTYDVYGWMFSHESPTSPISSLFGVVDHVFHGFFRVQVLVKKCQISLDVTLPQLC